MFSLFSHVLSALNAESEDRQCWAAAAELKADPCPQRPWEGSCWTGTSLVRTASKALTALTSHLPGSQTLRLF